MQIPLAAELRDQYGNESARIRQEFETFPDGLGAAKKRAALIDNIIVELCRQYLTPELQELSGLSIVALGGYGRGALLPHSDIDLLFLFDSRSSELQFKNEVGRVNQDLWDLRVRVSPSIRILAECGVLDRTNVEFTISLLDCRFLAGDRKLFTRLHEQAIPEMVAREWQPLAQLLSNLASTRHGKYGNTIFHLEPNIKECPGGLRDYNTACWLNLISALGKRREWPEPDSLFTPAVGNDLQAAVNFLFSVRSFLHFRHGRDDNALTWEAQDAAASRRIGVPGPGEPLSAAEWMRIYYRHARSISSLTKQLQDEAPAAPPSLYHRFQLWRSRVLEHDFSVVDGRIFLHESKTDPSPDLIFRVFEHIAEQGCKLSPQAERRLESAISNLAASVSSEDAGPELWPHLQRILISPHAAIALHAMHAVGLLKLILPEYKLIESLVIRDFYHRYTVDEHSLLAIESLQRLSQGKSEWQRRFAEVLSELEKPELLYLALLLHDVGKGLPTANHVQGSLQACDVALERLGLLPQEREEVRFLIGGHLEMSAALRRDIFDIGTVRAFAAKVGTPEQLKMLCLLTFADISAVNPEAMTPWKAENLWQLYITTTNYMNRSVDEERFHASQTNSIESLRALARVQTPQLNRFLEGFPQRYLRSYAPEQIAGHFEMALRLWQQPVQLALKSNRDLHELTIVTNDRPALFASITGALTAWGMDIVRASAFSNQSGTIVDKFFFKDCFNTLVLNPSERGRFQKSITQVLSGEEPLEHLLRRRASARKAPPAKVKVETRLSFDNSCSTHSTLLELIAQDCPGLLYRVTSILSQ
ncbi:MAG TPA: nucleotidyltransferase domain-containing protein, partial [Terriglobales bacterium]